MDSDPITRALAARSSWECTRGVACVRGTGVADLAYFGWVGARVKHRDYSDLGTITGWTEDGTQPVVSWDSSASFMVPLPADQRRLTITKDEPS